MTIYGSQKYVNNNFQLYGVVANEFSLYEPFIEGLD